MTGSALAQALGRRGSGYKLSPLDRDRWGWIAHAGALRFNGDRRLLAPFAGCA